MRRVILVAAIGVFTAACVAALGLWAKPKADDSPGLKFIRKQLHFFS